MFLTRPQSLTVTTLVQTGKFNITSITVHPFSGAATLYEDDRRALAIIDPDGTITYRAPERI